MTVLDLKQLNMLYLYGMVVVRMPLYFTDKNSFGCSKIEHSIKIDTPPKDKGANPGTSER